MTTVSISHGSCHLAHDILHDTAPTGLDVIVPISPYRKPELHVLAVIRLELLLPLLVKLDRIISGLYTSGPSLVFSIYLLIISRLVTENAIDFLGSLKAECRDHLTMRFSSAIQQEQFQQGQRRYVVLYPHCLMSQSYYSS